MILLVPRNFKNNDQVKRIAKGVFHSTKNSHLNFWTFAVEKRASFSGIFRKRGQLSLTPNWKFTKFYARSWNHCKLSNVVAINAVLPSSNRVSLQCNRWLATWPIVSFAAVIRVVTQRSSPLTAVSGEERCVTTLITAAKETTWPSNELAFVSVSKRVLVRNHSHENVFRLTGSFSWKSNSFSMKGLHEDPLWKRGTR